MKKFNPEITNPSPLLTDLKKRFSSTKPNGMVYLKRALVEELEIPLKTGLVNSALGIREAVLPEILKAFGIRSLTLTEDYDLSELDKVGESILSDKELSHENYLQNPELIAILLSLFDTCRTIAFDDWTHFRDATKIWPQLLSSIFSNLGNRNIEFIFYFGDASKKDRLIISQALETLSEFLKVGTVNLAFDEQEAFGLWKQLNGVGDELILAQQTISDLKLKYFSLFNSIEVTRLLIYSTNSAMLISGDEQFILTRKPADTIIELGKNARINFIFGYSAGLLFGESLRHSIAMGLIVFGACGEYEMLPESEAAQAYIDDWIEDLSRPESIYLYQ